MTPRDLPPARFLPLALSALLALLALAACTGAAEPNAEAFTAGVTRYLARRGDLCLAKNAWPIDVTQREIDSGARNALQMPVLERLGLVASTVAQVDVSDEGTVHSMKVRRYALTPAGLKYYLPREGADSAKSLNPAALKSDFCAARLSLDHVVGWEVHQPAQGAARQAVVTYTYRVDAAPWARDPEIQRVFPVVAGVVRGAGTARLQETFTQTGAGWVAVDLLGS